MLHRIFISLIAVLMMAGLFIAVPQHASADCASGTDIRSGISCASDQQRAQSVPGGIKTAVNTLLYVVGIAAVIVLIIGGLRFITAGGNPQSVNSAKDSILYAVIGIVVAILAYAIVNFVLGQFGA